MFIDESGMVTSSYFLVAAVSIVALFVIGMGYYIGRNPLGHFGDADEVMTFGFFWLCASVLMGLFWPLVLPVVVLVAVGFLTGRWVASLKLDK